MTFACGKSSSEDKEDASTAESCEPGHLGCDCDEGDTCNQGLTCRSARCVDVDAGVATEGFDAAGSNSTSGSETSGVGSNDSSDDNGTSTADESDTSQDDESDTSQDNENTSDDESTSDDQGSTGGTDAGYTGGSGSESGTDTSATSGGTESDTVTSEDPETSGTSSEGDAGSETGGPSPEACTDIVHPVRGTLSLSGLRGIEVAGDFVYATAGAKLYVVDISDKDEPAVVGDLDVLSTESPSELYMLQGHAILVDGEVLRVVDVSNPTAPSLTDSYTLTDLNTFGIASDGQYLYATTDTELHVLSLDDGVLSFVGKVSTAERAFDLAASGGYVYAIISSTVHVFDVSDPAEPAFAGAWADADNYSEISAITEDYLFIQASTTEVGARVLSLTNAGAPGFVGEWPWGTHVTQVDDHLIVASGSNVSELENSSPFDTIRAVGASFSASTDMAVAGDTVVTAGGGQITVLTRSRMPAYVAFGPDERVLASVLHENLLYYATTTSSTTSTGTVQIMDFTDPTAPVDLGPTVASVSIGRQLLVADGRLYTARSVSSASTEYVLSTYSLDEPTAPQLLGSTNLSGGVSYTGFSVQDNLFVGSRGYPLGFLTMDMTDPNAVVGVGSGEYGGTDWAMTRHGNFAIVATNGNGAERYTDVFLITDPAAPVRVVHSLGAIGNTFYHEGDTLYAVGSSTMGVYDISSLPTLAELGTTDILNSDAPHTPQASKFSHYLSTGTGSLVDVADPTNPTFVLSEKLGGRAPYHTSHALNGYQLLLGDHGWVVVDYCP